MTDLTDKWKNGKIEALEELINQIVATDDSRSLSDEYLKEKGLMTREECSAAVEYPYGIVMVISDYVLPYFKKLQVIEKEKQQFKELLKEWVQFEIEENPNDFTVISERMSELANKTNSAIGEKEQD